MAASTFIKAMHPKSEILPEPSAIEKILGMGWVGQLKVHGHRAQLHIPSEKSAKILAFNRQGKLHKKTLSAKIEKEIFRLFRPSKGWNVIDAEWLKEEEKIFVFDFLKKDGEILRKMTFPERHTLLPRAFISPHLLVLPIVRDLAACLKILASEDPHTEGLVFKSTTSAGFSDTSIVRCRRRQSRQ